MADNPRIEQLRRRVQQDPASIAFAQLAEEHRRAGDYEAAVLACRTGLALHPGYLSARITLGRSLVELGRFDEAQAELEHVLRTAPENLAAIRAIADLHERRDADPPASPPPHRPAPARDFESALRSSGEVFAHALETIDAVPLDLRLPRATDEETERGDRAGVLLPHGAHTAADQAGPTDAANADLKVRLYADAGLYAPPGAPDPALRMLESWLKAILAARETRR